MGSRTRRLAARTLLLASALALGLAANASASFVYTDIIDFNLTETTSTYGGGTQFHIGSNNGAGTVSYRWVDVPSKTTVISGNSCSDYALYGKDTISSGDTSYHLLFSGGSGLCFVLRGRTAAGQGSMSLYDGRLER
jgi:opacity protein-like surface antigen